MPNPLISVIVCTFNRSNLLRSCLLSLVNQTLDRALYEVIVVDNNSTDATQAVTTEFLKNYDNFKYTQETQQGLSFARNTGWQQACGTYVAYIDDDAIALPDWLSVMVEFIQAHPDVEAFGGPYDAYTLTDLPAWFPPEYGVHNLGHYTRPIQLGQEWIHGSNMVFTKELLEKSGGFNEQLGMAGSKVSYMEEIDFLLKLEQLGVSVYYVHTMKIKHLIADYKMNLAWLLKSTYSAGRSAKKTFMKDRTFYSHCSAVLKHFIFLFVKMLSLQQLPLKRRTYYALYWLTWELGAFAEYVMGS